jgi:hypothetical protein
LRIVSYILWKLRRCWGGKSSWSITNFIALWKLVSLLMNSPSGISCFQECIDSLSHKPLSEC